jgi:tetratricopeptide (TPR) repeat protein
MAKTRSFFTVVFLTSCLAVSGAFAKEGDGRRKQAEDAFGHQEYETAEKLFKKLIEDGELEQDAVIGAYVRLGGSRAMLGKKDEAVKAFRAAAVLDPNFVPTPDGNPKVIEAAQIARSSVAKLGPLVFEAKVPERVELGTPVAVTAIVDPAHLPMVSRLLVTVKQHDKENATVLATKSELSDPSGSTKLTLDELPKDVAEVDIQVSALDKFRNKIASQSFTRSLKAAVVAGESGAGGSIYGDRADSKKKKTSDEKDSVGIFSTAWPFVVGGVVLAAGGVSMYYYLSRPSVSTIGPATVGTK